MVKMNKKKPNYDLEDAVADCLKPVETLDFDAQSGELTKSEEPIKPTKVKKEKAPKPKSKKKTVIVTIILALIVLILGAGCWLCLWGNDIIAKITGGRGNLWDAFTSLISDETVPLKTDENGRTNILIFGTSGYDMDGTEGDGVHDGSRLTDSIMAVSLDQEAGDFAMLSLPRDLKTSDSCTGSKINSIFDCYSDQGENEEAGANALMNSIGKILGVEFQYYIHINWQSLVQIVDTLGGITVVPTDDIFDYGWTNAVYDAGVAYQINGEQALAIARARHGTQDGDYSRGNNQQALLVGIKNRIYEKNLSMIDMMNLANALGDNFRTNFSIAEIKSGAKLTFTFDFDKIRQVAVRDLFRPDERYDEVPISGNYIELQTRVKEEFLTAPAPESPEEEPEENPEEDNEEE